MRVRAGIMNKEKMSLDDIKNALKNDEFIFYYQPKISMVSGKIVGAEALIRWRMEDGTIVPPLEFIPLAEKSGFITELTRGVFQKLIADIVDTDGFGCDTEECSISFNASAQDFHNMDFIDDIRQVINKDLIDPRRIEIELTETSISIEKDISNRLSSLVDLGVGLAMDDFGTGYSTLDALNKSCFTAIKIDREIINQATSSGKGKEIVALSLRMGYQLGLDVIAEGIETEEVYTALQHLGCTVAQGYWISRPLPRREFVEFIRKDLQWPSSSLGILYLAQQEHIHWRKEIIEHAFFSGVKRYYAALEETPVIDYRSCGLGRWYYGKLGRKMNRTPTFESLGDPHKRLHQLGEKLLNAIEKSNSGKELEYIFHDFKTHSSIVMTLLQQLENEYLLFENNNKRFKGPV